MTHQDNKVETQGTLPTEEVEAGLHEARRLLSHVDKLNDDQIEQLRLLNDEIDTLEDEDDDEGDLDYDDPMDGDHASALASAGMGTDEDYGCFGGDDF